VEVDEISGIVVDVAVKLHRDLGCDLFESVYEIALAAMLERRGLRVARQQMIGFEYQGMRFENAFRADLVVENCVLIELKVVDKIVSAHRRQVLTYLRLADLPVGLLLNFGAGTMKEGLLRFVNDLPPSASSPLRINRPCGQ
jgi:iron complex transport system substrate-binding protein